MKLHALTKIIESDDSVQVTKNSGKHVASLPAHLFFSAVNIKNKQIVIEYASKRYGFDKQYVINFLNANSVENVDKESMQSYFNALRDFEYSS